MSLLQEVKQIFHRIHIAGADEREVPYTRAIEHVTNSDEVFVIPMPGAMIENGVKAFNMRVDVHTHIFPPGVVGERQRFFQGEPEFKLLYDAPGARLVSAEGLVEAMETDGVDVSVSFGFPWQNMDLARRHNDYVLESAAKYAPRILPLCCVNPLHESAASEVQRCMESGARGLGELAVYGECDEAVALAGFQDLIDCARDYGTVMLVHANEPVGHLYPGKGSLGLGFYYELARKAKGIPLILAHWGGGMCFYELMKREVKDVLMSVYYDTAASPFLYRSSIYSHMVGILGEKKILMGSDYPLLSAKRCMEQMREAEVTSEAYDAISGRNAAGLFGLMAQSSG